MLIIEFPLKIETKFLNILFKLNNVTQIAKNQTKMDPLFWRKDSGKIEVKSIGKGKSIKVWIFAHFFEKNLNNIIAETNKGGPTHTAKIPVDWLPIDLK